MCRIDKGLFSEAQQLPGMEFVEVIAARAKQTTFETTVDRVDLVHQQSVEQRFCYESRHKSAKYGIQYLKKHSNVIKLI